MRDVIQIDNCKLRYDPNRGVLYIFNNEGLGACLVTIYGLRPELLPPENLEHPGDSNIAEIMLRPLPNALAKAVVEGINGRQYYSEMMSAELR